MKQLLFILFVISFIYCSDNKKYVIEQYSALSVKFEKEKIVETNGNYSLNVPKNWRFYSFEPRYSTTILEHSFISENNNDIISICKMRDDADLKEINDSFIRFTETMIPLNIEKSIIVDYGKTDVLKYSSFFSHISSSDFEKISFVLKSKQEGFYYLLIIEGKKENMPMMLQCLKSFDILK